MRRSPLLHDLLELAWVVFFLDLIVVLAGSLIVQFAGRRALELAMALALIATLVMAMLVAANLLVIGALRLRDRRRRAKEFSRMTPQ